jgi:hypothetical protein
VFVKQGRTIHERTLAADSAQLEVELRLGAIDARRCVAGLSEFGAGVTESDGVVRLRVRKRRDPAVDCRWLVAHDVPLYEMRRPAAVAGAGVSG